MSGIAQLFKITLQGAERCRPEPMVAVPLQEAATAVEVNLPSAS